MPYVSQEQRENLLKGAPAVQPGELNFQITTLLTRYMSGVGRSYSNMNDVLGALEAAKQEFYRRVVVPYEQEKIKLNGDVY